ncbi:MAG: nitrous oxide reductase accessory protein NosL [Thermodesulfovibrionales bacterium]
MAPLVMIGLDMYIFEKEDSRARELQNYLGGFGLGGVISPEWGFLNYDPRIDFVDETSLWPIPGGYSYSPERGFSVADMKESPLLDLSSINRRAEHKGCDNCRMDLNKWAGTRYEFETSKGRFYTCSIHCLAVMAYYKLGEEPKKVKVAEYLRPERMLDAGKAFYVIGSSVPGTMSPVSIIAFSSPDEAEKFSRRFGGKVTDFKAALEEAKREIDHK